MNTQNFLAHLRELNIKLWVDGDRLRVDAPKGALTPELRTELAQRKEDLLSFLQPAQGYVEKENASPLQPVTRDQSLPLSFAQQRLWFFDQLVPGNPVYNIYTGLHFQEQLNLLALEQSLNEIIRRHESLRTIFPIVEGEPVQRIAPFQPRPLQIIDLRHLPDGKRDSEFRRIATEESKRSFDLTQGPLFRATLVQLRQEEYELLFNIHHIIADGWSVGLIFKELRTLYQAFSDGEPSPLWELPVQYADYAVWQRQWLSENGLAPQLEYWKKQLAGPLPVLELPSDRPRPKIQSFKGASHTFTVPLEVVNKLKTLGQRSETTLFMTLLTAFKVLLFRYTGQEDLLVGTPVAGRTRIEIERLIGLFVNTLVLRTDMTNNPSFLQLLTRVRDMSLDAFAHQDVPFEHLVEVLQPERDATRSPLFQVMFVYEKALTIPLEVDNSTAKFDLTLFFWEGSDRLTARLEYSTDLFESATIHRMAGHLLTLLEAITSDPEQHIADLPLLREEEKRLLNKWNETEQDYPRDACLYQLFEQQAEQTPDNIAVVFENEQLTYRQLNERANQLARHLQTLGVGAETPVGLSMARSADMVVALLGILKAGGTYIPLDPLFPQHRLDYMLEASQTRILLNRGQSPSSDGHGLQVVDLKRDWDLISQHSVENLTSSTQPENLAYIIFTSGSTGNPKGVQIPHQAVVNFLTSMRQKPGLTADDRLLSVTTLSFDISVLEIFLPLTTGACVRLVPGEAIYDGAALIRQLETGKITVMQATPATWQMLINAGWQGDQKLKVLCGGEALSPELAKWLTEHTGSVWNMYGPTETTVWSSLCEITCDTPMVTIGRPIANTQVYILDQNFASVPIGVAGELFIAGDGVARGYLNQPELTAERFLPDPFRNTGRMYKTGDQARFLADGQIDFIGRTDFQVKVRGFRIELGEIETVLNSHPDICQALVMVREDIPGDKRLVAYLIPETNSHPDAGELRQFIRTTLPEYMVPSFFVFLDEFPMTPNRKVNRKALPAPDQSSLTAEKDFVGARTETEEKLTRIWATILGVTKIDVYANFFELGGHSLLATRVMSQIREEFQTDLPLQALFMTPTIVGLSEAVDTMLWATQGQLTGPKLIAGNKDSLEI